VLFDGFGLKRNEKYREFVYLPGVIWLFDRAEIWGPMNLACSQNVTVADPDLQINLKSNLGLNLVSLV